MASASMTPELRRKGAESVLAHQGSHSQAFRLLSCSDHGRLSKWRDEQSRHVPTRKARMWNNSGKDSQTSLLVSQPLLSLQLLSDQGLRTFKKVQVQRER